MNRLHNEKSPYLLQHANNPVDWYPWGEEAFHKARSENKPIFLSIGYSTCHWCHVMEHESFGNESTASIMNEKFINIKLDREERPDIDKVYMAAVQMMTGSGGWPLSVFLTPDLKPFYGGTYFPPNDAHGRPGFPALLQKISEVWQSENENILRSGDELLRSLMHRHPVDVKNSEIDEMILKRTYHQIAAGYDPKYSGFGSGPKFPRPVIFNFLFRYYHRTKEQEALTMSLTTLMAMASGGMYDHIGGGFHRYSVDAQWRIPHFEKMLYDQAQLVQSYLDAYQITHEKFFARIAEETLGYVMRDMTSPSGGFYSAEDADSADPKNPGHPIEGAFYVWEKNEIDKLLTKDEARVFCCFYAVEQNGNALADPHNEFRNKNILYSPFTAEQAAEQTGIPVSIVEHLLESGKGKIFSARTQRPRPHLDDKILTSWNGLMIAAFARASRVLGKKEYVDAAVHASNFIRMNLFDREKKILKRRFRDGEAKFDAHLDDYAFFISGLLEVYDSTYDIQWIQLATDLAGTMITLFWDSAEGGFYDTAGKDQSVLVRMKESYDGAEPAGNSAAAAVLFQMYSLTGNTSWKDYSEKTLRYFSAMLSQSPQVMPKLMSIIEQYISPPEHLVIVYSAENVDERSKFIAGVERNFHPQLCVIGIDEESQKYFSKEQLFIKDMRRIKGKTTAYFCRNYICELPTNSIEIMIQQLNA